MSDEIKEILELFGSADENIMFCDIVELNSKQSHLLLDYITNLQQENDRLNNIINELEKSWKEQQEYYRYRKDNRYRSFLNKNLDKIKELKENNRE